MKLINAQNFWNDGDDDKNNDKQQPYDDIPVCLAEANKITFSYMKRADRIGLGRNSHKSAVKNVTDYMKPSPVKVIDADGEITYKVDDSTPKTSSGIDKEYLYRNLEDIKQIAALVCAEFRYNHPDDYNTEEIQRELYRAAYREIDKYIYAQQRAEPVNMYSQEFDAIQRESIRDRYFYKEVDEFDVLHDKLQEWGIATNRRRDTVERLEEYITLQLTVKNASAVFANKHGARSRQHYSEYYQSFKDWLKI